MKDSLRTRGFALAVVIGLLLTACASDPDADSRSPSSSISGSGAPSESGSSAETLRLAIQTGPSDFSIGNWDGGGEWPYLAVYDTVLHLAADGAIRPQIAESWKYSDGNKTLTLQIRRGVRFSDGTPLDAAAVAASLNASKSGQSASQYYLNVRSIKAADDSTVVVTMSRPDAAFLTSLTRSPGAVGLPSLIGDDEAELHPIGSGPYVLDSGDTTVGAVYTFTRNELHWEAEDYPFQTVQMRTIPDLTAAFNALQAGQLDWTSLTPDQANALDTQRFTIGENNPISVLGLFFADKAGTMQPALADVRVRRAINMAIDREGIVETINQGVGFPTNQVVCPTGEVYNPDKADQYEFDPEQARSLMADAGYADGFELTIPSLQGITTNYEAILSQELGDIGIRVNWDPVPTNEVFPRIFAGRYAVFFLGTGLVADPQDVTQAVTGLFNPLDYTTPEFESLFAAANAGATQEEVVAGYRALNDYLVDEAWFAPVVCVTGKYAVSNQITYEAGRTIQMYLRPFQLATDE